jgi:serine protease AprX
MVAGVVKQYRDLLSDETPKLGFVSAIDKPFIESVAGFALIDTSRTQTPVMLTLSGAALRGKRTKKDRTCSLVHILGIQDAATSFSLGTDITVAYKGQEIVLGGQNDIPDIMKGYVQLAINLSLMNVTFSVQQESFGLAPTLSATFKPTLAITRAHYAELTTRLYLNYSL